MAIPQRMKEIRNDFGLTQKEFADKYHVGISTIQRCENGAAFPTIEMLIDFALSGYNLHWVLTGDGDKMRTKSIATDALFRAIHDWVNENQEKDPGYREWFRIQFEMTFPTFKEWRKNHDDMHYRNLELHNR